MSTTEPEYITIGQILAPWGVRGKIRVAVTTDFPQRFAPDSKVYLNHQPVTIDSAQWHKGRVIVKLGGIDSAAAAQKLRGQALEIPSSQLKTLPEGEYYLFQIIGLKVWTTGGELLGTVAEVHTSRGNDTYLVRGEQGEILIPAIEDVIKSIDLKKQRMTIEPMEGLLTLNSKRARKQ
jgi:16S rRNA processing protein RimM